MVRRKAEHLRHGREAENAAYEYLKNQGLRLLDSNYRTPFGEIDLIMQQRDVIVFVEVRYRRSEHFGTPAETIDARKQARLRATAAHYLQRNRKISKQPCRFDIVALSGLPRSDRVVWLQNAL